MRTISFREVLETSLAYCGQKFDETLTVQQSLLANFINRHMAIFWTWGPWPEWTYSEERAWADDWADTVGYVEDDIVWHNSGYYVALQAGTGQNPTAATTYWSATTLTTREIAYDQYGKTKIGTAWKATLRNTQVYELAAEYPIQLTATGVRVPKVTTNTIWLKYSPPAPRYTGQVFSATPALPYQRYDLVFYPGTDPAVFPHRGDVYQADYDVDGNPVWIWVPFPALAFGYVTLAAAADLTQYYGKSEQADSLKSQADDELHRESRKAGIGPEIYIER
jgi:hypothetical protein